jgi:hypothetical protein
MTNRYRGYLLQWHGHNRSIAEVAFPDLYRRVGQALNDEAEADYKALIAEINKAPALADTTPTDPPEPEKLLRGWRNIAEALGEKYAQRARIKRLNETFNGPISHLGQGTSPMVSHKALLDWWNRLAIAHQDRANQRAGAKASANTSYNYGRDSVVAPEIGGSHRLRRQRRQT